MQASPRHLDPASTDNDYQTIRRESPDDADCEFPTDSENRLGIKVSLLVLGVALLIAAIWLASRPSFEKCSYVANATERNACYEQLRTDLLKPPAKG